MSELCFAVASILMLIIGVWGFIASKKLWSQLFWIWLAAVGVAMFVATTLHLKP